MTGTRIHGYLISAMQRENTLDGKPWKYGHVFIYENTEGKFVICGIIDDDVALQSWVGEQAASHRMDDVANKFEQMKHFRVREFWHTLS